MNNQRRRVAITGLGCCSSLGWNRETVVRSLREENTTFRESNIFPEIAICPVTDLGNDKAMDFLSSWRHRRYLSRPAFFSVLSGLRAARDAGFSTMPPDTALIGTATPTLDFEREKGLPPAPTQNLDALWLLRWLPNTANSVLSALLNIHGEGMTTGCACASALQALGEGFLRIAYGLNEQVLVTCGDSRLSSGGLAGYSCAHTLSQGFSPEKASRPFDKQRTGFVPGEGGAAFILENLETAKKRNAHILAEVGGFAATLDGTSLTAPDPTGNFAEQAVLHALACAQLNLKDISWISTHGSGTRLNDAAEACMLKRTFLKHKNSPAILAIKSWIGHTASACGGLEAAILLSAAEAGLLPYIRNLETPDPSGLAYVYHPLPCNMPSQATHKTAGSPLPSTRTLQLAQHWGVIENFGFGGQNAVLVIKPCP